MTGEDLYLELTAAGYRFRLVERDGAVEMTSPDLGDLTEVELARHRNLDRLARENWAALTAHAEAVLNRPRYVQLIGRGLRPYQAEAMASVEAAPVIVDVPPGSGKSSH